MSAVPQPEVTPIALGIVGAGRIVRDVHLPGFATLPGVEVVAVANQRRANAEAVARDFGIPKVHDSWQDVVDDDRVQAVVIGTPPYLHAAATLRALDRGKHVFCQARMADDLGPAMDMLSADGRTDLTTMLCPPPHYRSIDAHVRRLLGADGPLGEVRHVVVEHASGSVADPHAPLHWRQRHDVNGINALDVGIVAEVLDRWFGPVAEVGALARTWVPERNPDASGRTTVDNPDALSVTGTFARGATLTALFSGAAPHGDPRLIVHGEHGSLRCRPFDPGIQLRSGGESTGYDVPDAERVPWQVEGDFVDAVRRGVKGDPSFHDGARYMAVTRAITDAARTGSRVRVHDV